MNETASTPTADPGGDTARSGSGVPSKSVGIVTYHFVVNYGAVWQTWALQEALRGLGCSPVVVDYRPSHVARGGRFRLGLGARDRRANLVIAYQKYLHLRSQFGFRRAMTQSFAEFEDKHFKRTPRAYATPAQLAANMPEVDALVCGSDQIWNPSQQRGLDPAYFLDFAAPDIKRIAYAPSFGRPQIEPQFVQEMKPWLERFDALSIREASGRQLIRDAGVEAPVAHLPDPTLLCDEFPAASPPNGVPEKYLFSYVLRSGEGINAIQRSIAERRGLEIVTPRNPHSVASAGHHMVVPSPEQWLGCIRHADAVVTNSFHGTLFSIIFRKPFLVIGIGSGKAALNERVKSLFEKLGLEERLIDPDRPDQAVERLEAPIDWDAVHGRISAWRGEALNYLADALGLHDDSHPSR